MPPYTPHMPFPLQLLIYVSVGVLVYQSLGPAGLTAYAFGTGAAAVIPHIKLLKDNANRTAGT